MTFTRQNAPVTLTPAQFVKAHCVFEHWIGDTLIYVSACRLRDVYNLTEGRNNSEWCKIAAPGAPLTVRIVATVETRAEAVNTALRHMRACEPMPRCNVHGYAVAGSERRLLCSNGLEYANQSEAAKLLGISQAQISQHLNGRAKHVRGYTFAYKGSPL